MNKKELISSIKNENKIKNNKQIESVYKAYDYLKNHKYKQCDRLYLINNNSCVCTLMDLRNGILEFMPLSADANIGTEYAGGTLRLEF